VALTQLIFDLDNTLYPPSRGVVDRVDERINRYLIERLGMSSADAGSLRARYRDAHGTTLNGLMLHHEVDPDEYLTMVHEIAVEELLVPDPLLGAMLATLEQRKAIFTNGSASHAERVLACLGVRSHFPWIFSLESVAYVPKPHRAAFETVLARLDADASECLFVDDRADNLATARALGMRTILVRHGGASVDASVVDVDGVIASILELPAVLAGS
jgi:putative hydrolase of the HAD superfamily